MTAPTETGPQGGDLRAQLAALRAERDALAATLKSEVYAAERRVIEEGERRAAAEARLAEAEQKARIYKAVLDGPVEASAAAHYHRTGDDPVSYAGFCRERKRADAAEARLREVEGALREADRDIISRQSRHQEDDHACAECRPYSDLLVAGWKCPYHAAAARAALAGEEERRRG